MYEELMARWGRRRRLGDEEARLAAGEWRRELGVRQAVALVRIARSQVANECGRRGCSLVGVVYDEQTARIYHTRALMSEDIIHELLHVAHPHWSEEAVVRETDRLMCQTTSRHPAAASSPREPAPTPCTASTCAASRPVEPATPR